MRAREPGGANIVSALVISPESAKRKREIETGIENDVDKGKWEIKIS